MPRIYVASSLAQNLGLDWWGIIYPKWVDAELNKRFTCREVREISDALASVGIERYGFLLLGGPGETRESVEESLEFADSLHLDALKITMGLRIYPQTPLASSALADGLIRPDDDLLMPRFYITPCLRDWLPDRIARRESSQA